MSTSLLLRTVAVSWAIGGLRPDSIDRLAADEAEIGLSKARIDQPGARRKLAT